MTVGFPLYFNLRKKYRKKCHRNVEMPKFSTVHKVFLRNEKISHILLATMFSIAIIIHYIWFTATMPYTGHASFQVTPSTIQLLTTFSLLVYPLSKLFHFHLRNLLFCSCSVRSMNNLTAFPLLSKSLMYSFPLFFPVYFPGHSVFSDPTNFVVL